MAGKIIQRPELEGGATVGGVEVINSSGQVVADIKDTLASGKIYVGNSSNVSAEVTMSGDATLSNTGVITVVRAGVSALVGSEARTATGDGLTTGAITTPTKFRTFITVTSAAATNAITLPAITAGTIGQEVFLTVTTNGYELLTPASSNNTINQVDSDGTNQLDVAADTTVRCTQISATAWLAETIAATTIAITAPDND